MMVDGGKLDYNKDSKNKAIVLNTHSFTDSEVLILSKELTEKFKFNTHIRNNKGKKVVIINADSYFVFRNSIDNYIIPEMVRKLP